MATVHPEKCYIYLYDPADTQTKIALECQATRTGSDLLEVAQAKAPSEIKAECFYAKEVGSNMVPSPRSNIVSITVGRSECDNHTHVMLCYSNAA